jgi:hypothetical protein
MAVDVSGVHSTMFTLVADPERQSGPTARPTMTTASALAYSSTSPRTGESARREISVS